MLFQFPNSERTRVLEKIRRQPLDVPHRRLEQEVPQPVVHAHPPTGQLGVEVAVQLPAVLVEIGQEQDFLLFDGLDDRVERPREVPYAREAEPLERTLVLWSLDDRER